MRNRGFTLIELLVVVTIIGAMSVMALPRLRDGMTRESLRGSRRAVTTMLAQARGVAVTRGCLATVHFSGGADATVWVTACAADGGPEETVGTVEQISDRYGVTMESSTASIVFAPTGMALASAWTRVLFTKGALREGLRISPVGRSEW